jgi:hypothetical protein
LKTTNLAACLAAPLLVLALSLPALADSNTPASTTCKDGTTSTATGRGACSGHGGVQKAAATAPVAPAMPATAAAPAASATCEDGTKSTATGKGACSGHGGVLKPLTSKPAPGTAMTAAPAAATSTAPKSATSATAGNTAPTGATAKCKDGTYSKSTHKAGTCSTHGGVADWLTAAQ